MSNGRALMPRTAALLLAVLALAAHGCHAEIYHYRNEMNYAIEWQRSPMFAPGDVRAQSPGNGESYVEFDMQFTREYHTSAGLFQVLVFHDDEINYIGHDDEDGEKLYCCTEALHEAGVEGCSTVGHVIVQPHARGTHYNKQVPFEAGQASLRHTERALVNKTGIYYLLWGVCDALETGSIAMTGRTVWMNPYGYLRADLFPLLDFYAWMATAYVAVAVVWLLLNAKNWGELLALHHYISVVLLLGLVEHATWYFDLAYLNEHGERHSAPIITAIIFSTLRKTVSRMLVLVVAMGLGTVRPSLDGKGWRIVALGVVYAVFSSVLDVVTSMGHTSSVSSGVRFLVVVPVAVLDGTFYWWIFYSLFDTISYLSERNQGSKLRMFKRFTFALVVSIVGSAMWVLFQIVYVVVNHTAESNWQHRWMFDCYWHVLYLAVLLVIMFIWGPDANSSRYAYSEQLAMDESEGANDEEKGGIIEMDGRRLHGDEGGMGSDETAPAFTLHGDGDEEDAEDEFA